MSPEGGAAGVVDARLRPRVPAGVLLGAVGVLAFSVSLPATKAAVDGDLAPLFVGFGRAVVAAALAAAFLVLTRAPRPDRSMLRSLVLCGLGVVVGFPVLTSLALAVDSAAHAVVITGVIPAATAVFAVVRAGERPSAGFWAAALVGLAIVLVFAGVQSGAGFGRGDVLLLVAVALCGLGYAEGAVLARTLGGPTTISWALVVSLPVTLTVAGVVLAVDGMPSSDGAGWLGFAYVSVVSMFLGFFAWYAGLARGGVAKVGQVQLAQPLLSLGWAAVLLGETVGWAEAVTSVAIIVCVAGAQRARVSATAAAPGVH